MRTPTEDLNLFAEGYRVNRSVASRWLEWQGLAVPVSFLIEHGLVRGDGATAHVIWPHTFRADVVMLDVEYRLGQSPSLDDEYDLDDKGVACALATRACPPGGLLPP